MEGDDAADEQLKDIARFRNLPGGTARDEARAFGRFMHNDKKQMD